MRSGKLDGRDDILHALARRALAVLRATGNAADGGAAATVATRGAGAPLEISYAGPDLPDEVPGPVADYAMVTAQPPGWRGRHRLVVRAPLVVFDLCWNPDEPLRIMGFSRGDWENDLMEVSA